MLSLFAVGRSATGRKMVGTADASPRPQSERSSGNAEGSSRPSAQHVALDPLSTRQPVARDHFAGPTGIEPSGRPHVLTHGKGTTMSKATVARLFIGSVIAVTAGAILASMAVWLALANDVFVMAGPDFVGVRGALTYSLLGLGIVGGLAITGALIGGLVSWIGALLNTWRLETKSRQPGGRRSPPGSPSDCLRGDPKCSGQVALVQVVVGDVRGLPCSEARVHRATGTRSGPYARGSTSYDLMTAVGNREE